MAASYSDLLTYTYASKVTGAKEPVTVDMQSVSGAGTAKAASTFDQMVPGLLVLALMMLMFTTAASVIREKDKGTITRLLMSHMGAFDFLASISLAQILIGIAAVGLTFLTAIALGYHSHGSLVAVLVICVLCTLSIIAISLIVAAFLRSIFDLMTIGNFPFFVLMFFSGGMFPLPDLQVLTIARPRDQRQRRAADHARHRRHGQSAELRDGPGRSRVRAGAAHGAHGRLLRRRPLAVPAPVPEDGVTICYLILFPGLSSCSPSSSRCPARLHEAVRRVLEAVAQHRRRRLLHPEPGRADPVLKKIDVSVAYAIWSGLGTALIACIGFFYFKEPPPP